MPTQHLHTPRLTLRLLTSSSNPRDLQLYHENWSSRTATIWSMRGPTTTLEESRARMDESLAGGMHFWAVFLRGDEAADESEEERGAHVGSVSIKPPRDGLMVPRAELEGEERELSEVGYAFFPEFWGMGIATEAGRAVLGAHAEAVRARGKKGYVEACVDDGNPASGHVLGKIGFEQVGWKAHDPVWINGAWREGCWVYGMHI